MNWLSQIFGFFKAFQCWITVAPWESALRVRFGRSSKVLGPGPHWRIPFLDRIFVQSVRLRTISDTGQTMTTRDGKILTLAVAVSYAIDDIERLYHAVANPEATMLHQIQGHIARLVSGTRSDQLTPQMLEELVLKQMPSTEWGMSEVRLMVTNFVYARCYRLLNYEYRTLSSANELDQGRPNAN